MRILIVSTLKRRIAADEFASRSRVIFQIASGLVARGHEVSLLGTGDSVIPGVTIIPVIEKGWVDLPPVENSMIRDTADLIRQAKMMVDMQGDFDVIHNHTTPDFFPHILDEQLSIPLVSTMHAVFDKTYLDQTLSIFHNSYFVALSEAYTKQFTETKFAGIVYNGIDTELFSYAADKGDYLLWLGRLPKAQDADGVFMDPKGVRHAIKLAQETGLPLKVYGVVEDRAFYEHDVEPYLSDKIQWVGGVGPEQSLPIDEVVSLMQGAKAFLMTVNQPENFGLVMAEAMSTGTPVIAFRRGSIPEVVEDDKTGFVVDPEEGVAGLQRALEKIDTIKPEDCRKRVEEHFSITAMVETYVKVYEELITRHVKKQ